MYFYLVALEGKPLAPLTYKSCQVLPIGTKVRVPLRFKILEGYVVKECEEPTFECQEIVEVTPFYLSLTYLDIARFIAEYYFCSIGEALGLFVPFRTKNEKRGTQEESSYHLPILSPKQQEALKFLKSHDTALLFGDTGSGKTEIYMKLFEEVLRKGQSAVFLMPEISLTPQMEKRLSRHFGNTVAIWHSKVAKKKRAEVLEKIHDGTVRIVAGPRSALFLPLPTLALIVVDEEHDDSYKSNSRPRYHARDLAVYMGKKLGARVVLGSATPSLSSYTKYPFFRLKGGYLNAKKRFIFEPSGEVFSPLVLEKLQHILKSGQQAIIFLPTRANFKYLVCTGCGKPVMCPYCSVGMSLHRKERALKCHYCGFVSPIPVACPSCQAKSLKLDRIGTSEVAEQLLETFPQASIAKFDKDAITTHAKLIKTLLEFGDKKIDILVGTQMLSKGHDYPGISLAVVVGIDYILGMADYRSRERAVGLLIQIAGRSGRAKEGEVIVQTFNSPFFKRYIQDYETFLKEELINRKGFYPPFVRLALILFSHKDAAKAAREMEEMVKNLGDFPEVEIVGFGPSPIEKIAGKFRYQILLRSHSAKALIQAIAASRTQLAEVDMDPVSFA